MDTSMTPVAIFAYNRPDHIQSALSSLASCSRLADCRLVIYCDGPKTPAQDAGVAATRRVVRDWALRLNAEVIEREKNQGLARSIVSGVTEQCQKFGRTIVVEDDLVVSPDFLDYMLQALDRYQEYANVYQISGFMYPISHPTSPDAFFLPLSTTWGWATWERAWRIFSWDAGKALVQLADTKKSKQFDLDGSFPYTAMLRQREEAHNDSWGILWWYVVFQADGLVLHPRQSLVWNGGFDNSGIHSGAPSYTMQSARDSINQPRLGKPLVYPKEVIIDQEAFNRLKKYLRSRSNRRNRLMGMLLKLRRTLIDRQEIIHGREGR
jgi:hypothetical protein